IQAGGAFSLTAGSSSNPTIQVYAIEGAGGIGVSQAWAAEPVTFETDAFVGSAAKIRAGGSPPVDTKAWINALDETSAFAAAVGVGVAEANHDNASGIQPNGISVTGDSKVEIGQGATLQADTVDLSALISQLQAKSHAGAEAIAVGAGAYA